MSSLDWLISIGLLPLSFALTGPVSALIGARSDADRWPGVVGGAVTLAALFLPGMRDIERAAPVVRLRAAAPEEPVRRAA